MRYRKRPVVVEAVRWTGENTTELLRWMCPELPEDARASELTIKTLEGEMRAAPGDWIIRGVKGEFCPCKPDVFAATYDAVREGAEPDAHAAPACVSVLLARYSDGSSAILAVHAEHPSAEADRGRRVGVAVNRQAAERRFYVEDWAVQR